MANDGYGANAPLTAGRILALLLTVDGDGSGLDADTVDGKNPGSANGLATLGADGKVPSAQLPALALTDVHVVASEVAQLALTVEEGDVAVRTDEGKSYIHNGGSAGDMTDWTELQAPGAVSAVFGLTGAVTIPDLTDEAAADDADSIAIYDNSAGAHREQTRANFLSGVQRESGATAQSGATNYTQADNTAATAVTGMSWATATYRGVEISYTLARGTTKARQGTLRLIQINGNVTIDDTFTDEATGGALGCTFTADISAGNMRVLLAVDASNTDDVFLTWEAKALKVYA